MIKKAFFSRQFVIFIITGSIAALANLLSRMVFGLFMPYIPSILCAYVIGTIFAYSLFRVYVFGPSKHTLPRQIIYFLIINTAAITLTVLVSVGLYKAFFFIDDNFLRETIAHTIGIGATPITSFLGHKYLTFQHSPTS